MTYTVVKDGDKYNLSSKTQLDAFLNSGWKLKEEVAEEKPVTSSDDNKSKRKYTRKS